MGLTAKQAMNAADVRIPMRGQFVDFYPNEGVGPQVAIVTKVHSPDCVNLQVFFDGASVQARTSVLMRARNSSAISFWDYQSERKDGN